MIGPHICRKIISIFFSDFRARKDETRIKYFVNSNNFSGNEATTYGLIMEPLARKKFEEVTDHSVVEVGLIVRPGFDFFGGSVDGIFLNKNGELCNLELKCPLKCKDQEIEMDYLERVLDDGSLKTKLRKTHSYYTQVQLQMFATRAKISHFFVYSNCDYKHIVIDFDESFC